MQLTRLLGLILVLSILGCEKPDPNPHLKDPRHQFLVDKAAASQVALDAAKKDLAEWTGNWQKAKPQTGERKRAQGKIDDIVVRVKKHEQEVEYYKLAIKALTKEVKRDYLQAWNQKKPWSPSVDPKSFEAEQKLRGEGLQSWSAKRRIEKYEASRAPASPGKAKH